MSPVFSQTFDLKTVGLGGTDYSKTIEKIRSFTRLPHGWYYGSGVPVTWEIARIALDYLWMYITSGISETDAFPGADGAVMVTAYKGDHYIEVTVEIDRTFAVAHQVGGQTKFYEPGLSGMWASTELTNILGNIRQECDTSGSSAYGTTTIAREESSMIWRLAQLGTAPQYFPNPVDARLVARHVPISISSTKGLEATLQFSGNLINYSSTNSVGSSNPIPPQATNVITR